MFTGLIETVGEVADVTAGEQGARIGIATALASGMAPGDSLAVNGVCLTVTEVSGDLVRADVGPETARLTTLGRLRPGVRVNLERPLAADGRLGGHFVQGHVDDTGRVLAIRREDEAQWLTIGFPSALAPYFIRKGAVAVDGVSLTVAELREDSFDVMIIPFTWAHTALARLRVQDEVNLECDMVGKYVVRALALTRHSGQTVA